MEEDLGFRPPFTLGHENAGWVAELGGGVTSFKEGDAVAVYGPGAVAGATPASFRWTTTARTGPRLKAVAAALVWMAVWRNTCWFPLHVYHQ